MTQEMTIEGKAAQKRKNEIKFISNLVITEVLNSAATKTLLPMVGEDSVAVRMEILRVSRQFLSKVLKQDLELEEPVEGLALRCKRHVQIFCARDVREIKIDLT